MSDQHRPPPPPPPPERVHSRRTDQRTNADQRTSDRDFSAKIRAQHASDRPTPKPQPPTSTQGEKPKTLQAIRESKNNHAAGAEKRSPSAADTNARRVLDRRNPETTPQINAVFRSLEGLQSKLSPEHFAKVLQSNERDLVKVLGQFGYQGSRATTEGTLKDFSAAHDTWNRVRQEARGMPSVEQAQGPTDTFDRLKMWHTAATDPVAAVPIGAGHVVSEFLGERLGIQQDPVKAAASGKVASEVIKVTLALGVAFRDDARIRRLTKSDSKEGTPTNNGAEIKNDATKSLTDAETAALKAALGISGKMTDPQKGAAAEVTAGWLLSREGHQVLGAIQNSRGNGLDLVTVKDGRYNVWEVKSNDAAFSSAQRNPSQFVVTRIYDANRPGHGTYSDAARDLGYRLQDALRDNQVVFGRVRIRFTE